MSRSHCKLYPFVTGSLSQQHPYEDIYMDPVFDMRDLTGDFDANGNPNGDGLQIIRRYFISRTD